MKKFVADANIGLRMLVGRADLDAAKSQEERSQILHKIQITHQLMVEVDAGKASLVFDDAVVEEMVFVLRSHYKMPRSDIARSLLLLLDADNVNASDLIRDSVRLYGTTNVDIVDIKLSLLSKSLGVPVLTWDKDFNRLNCEYYAPTDIIIDDGDLS